MTAPKTPLYRRDQYNVGDFPCDRMSTESEARWHLDRMRLKKFGLDPEDCMLVEPGVWVTREGRFVSTQRAKTKWLSLQASRDGYLRTGVYRKGKRHWVYAHRAVIEAFHWPPPPGKPLACHINGNKTDNRAENLKWGDAQDNVDDRETHLRESILHPYGLALPRYDPDTLHFTEDDLGGAIWPFIEAGVRRAKSS